MIGGWWLMAGGWTLEACVERALEQVNRRAGTVDLNRHHVESARAVRETMPGDVVERHLRDAPPFAGGHGVHPFAEFTAIPRLHLDEDQRLAVAGDDVEFATAAAVAPGKYDVPSTLQLRARKIFACSSAGIPYP